jgi:phosphoenolpyruvate phosphomutase
MKQVLVSFRLDGLSPAHLDVIRQARELGQVTVSLLTDAAIWGHAPLPSLNLQERIDVVRAIGGVHRVELQHEWSYLPSIETHKPDIFVHGQSWDHENQRQQILSYLTQNGIELVEVPSRNAWLEPSHRSRPFSDSAGDISPDARRRSLSALLDFKNPVLAVEAHSSLSALIVDKASAQSTGRRFDALWSSSLTDSALSGLPDIELMSFDRRLENIRSVMRVTHLPYIMDLDTGGEPDILGRRLNDLELAGVSACVVEDKMGLKRNSLLGTAVVQHQADIGEFSEKISTAKSYQKSRDFLLIARVESLILEAGMQDALQRAHEYVAAGADGIMIHSRLSDPNEIFTFMGEFKSKHQDVPVVVVPTTFNGVPAEELGSRGASIVIYANHRLRASAASMLRTAGDILLTGSSSSTEPTLMGTQELFQLIPGDL